MEIISKIISLIKIPLKIILPALCLFSGILIFANDTFLERLNLLKWCNENGFVIGLIFLITLCILLIYIIYYMKSRFNELIFKFTYKRKTIKRIVDMNNKEYSIIMYLYKKEGYTGKINFADPNVKALIALSYIYIGNNVPCTIRWNNEMIVSGTLQPIVWESLQWINEKLQRKINKLQNKKLKIKNSQKIDKINKDIHEYKKLIEMFGGDYSGQT